jgi:hypothetical protein
MRNCIPKSETSDEEEESSVELIKRIEGLTLNCPDERIEELKKIICNQDKVIQEMKAIDEGKDQKIQTLKVKLKASREELINIKGISEDKAWVNTYLIIFLVYYCNVEIHQKNKITEYFPSRKTKCYDGTWKDLSDNKTIKACGNYINLVKKWTDFNETEQKAIKKACKEHVNVDICEIIPKYDRDPSGQALERAIAYSLLVRSWLIKNSRGLKSEQGIPLSELIPYDQIPVDIVNLTKVREINYQFPNLDDTVKNIDYGTIYINGRGASYADVFFLFPGLTSKCWRIFGIQSKDIRSQHSFSETKVKEEVAKTIKNSKLDVDILGFVVPMLKEECKHIEEFELDDLKQIALINQLLCGSEWRKT